MGREYMGRELQYPIEQKVFGQLMYWLCIACGGFLLVAMVVAIIIPGANILNPSLLYASLWRGERVAAIWTGLTGAGPLGHAVWQRHPFTADGLGMIGLVMALIGPAIVTLVSGACFVLKKSYGYALLSFWITFLIIASMFGIG